jgi:hypothetical protein
MAPSRLLLLLLLVACSGGPSSDGPDAGSTGDGGIEPDAALCTPACSTEANAEVACTVFATCESTCNQGYSRCGDTCEPESPMKCGPGCETCPNPSNGVAVCSDGVCGATCSPGYVLCDGYSGVSCCPYASEVVAPSDLGGYMPSIATDASGKVHLAYYNSAEHELVYAAETTGFVRETARWYWSSGGGARFTLALGAKGPLILYTYPNGRSGLFLAERRSTGWSHSTLVANSTPNGFGFATDRGGRAHACFTTSAGGVSYAIRRGDKWTITQLPADTEAKGACAIAVGPDGIPQIAYVRTTAWDVVYAKGSTAGTFTTSVVDTAGTVGSELSIAVTGDGTPHIAAYRSDTQDLRWAVPSGSGWAVQDVSSGKVGASPRITIAGNGLPVITWFDYDYYRVAIALRTASQTWTELVFEDIANGLGAIASAPDGSIWVATGDRDILIHNHHNGAWASYGIDFEDKAGYDITLLHTSAQQPRLVYTKTHDNTERVEIATRTNGGWSYAELATPGSTPVAAIDGSDTVHVAYQTGSTISYALGGTTEPVAMNAYEPSLALSSAGVPHVAYIATLSSTSYALMLAVKGSSGWSATAIGAPGPYATYRNPIVRVVNGVVHLQWYDGVARTIVYASSADGYVRTTIEPTAEGGHDLYVSPAGVPHACVFRRGTSRPDLRYATRATATWSNVFVPAPGTRLNSGGCAIRGNASGEIAIARSMVYGAGLGELVLTTLGAATTHTSLQDDFYASGLGVSVGANGFEVATTGRPYDGSGQDQNRVRWAHK